VGLPCGEKGVFPSPQRGHLGFASVCCANGRVRGVLLRVFKRDVVALSELGDG